MMAVLLLFRTFLTIGRPVISRIHGLVLLAVYLLYTILGYIVI
jgi:hypothetical protein